MAGSTTSPTTSMVSMIRNPAAKIRYPTSPRTPDLRTCDRYIPVIPTNASTEKPTFRLCRRANSVVVMKSRVSAGWLIWTAMNSRPATTALSPAARVSWVVVTDI